jgi:hypothetical protein
VSGTSSTTVPDTSTTSVASAVTTTAVADASANTPVKGGPDNGDRSGSTTSVPGRPANSSTNSFTNPSGVLEQAVFEVPGDGSADDRTLCAHVFADLNVDGVQQQGEVDLPGMSLRVRAASSGLVRSGETNVRGDVCVGPLPAGEYTVELRSPTNRLVYLDPDVSTKLVTRSRTDVLGKTVGRDMPVPAEVAFTGSNSSRLFLLSISALMVGFGLVLLNAGRGHRKRTGVPRRKDVPPGGLS